MAQALGAHGERVEKPEEMAPALERALAKTPAVVDVVTSQAAVSSDAQKGWVTFPITRRSRPGTRPRGGDAQAVRRNPLFYKRK